MSACDTSTGVPHLFILIKFCCTMFHSLPSLSLILEYKPLNTSSLLGMFGTMMLGGGLNVPRYNDILLRHSPHLQTLMDNRLNLFSGDTLCNFQDLPVYKLQPITQLPMDSSNIFIVSSKPPLSPPHSNSWTDSLPRYSNRKMLAAVQLSLYMALVFVYLVNSSLPLPKTIRLPLPCTQLMQLGMRL